MDWLSWIPRKLNFNTYEVLLRWLAGTFVVPTGVELVEWDPYFTMMVELMFNRSDLWGRILPGTSYRFENPNNADRYGRFGYDDPSPGERNWWPWFRDWIDDDGFQEEFAVDFYELLNSGLWILRQSKPGQAALGLIGSCAGEIDRRADGYYYSADHRPNVQAQVPFEVVRWYYDYARNIDEIISLQFYLAGEIKDYGKAQFNSAVRSFLRIMASEPAVEAALEELIGSSSLNDVFLLCDLPAPEPGFCPEGAQLEDQPVPGSELDHALLDWFRNERSEQELVMPAGEAKRSMWQAPCPYFEAYTKWEVLLFAILSADSSLPLEKPLTSEEARALARLLGDIYVSLGAPATDFFDRFVGDPPPMGSWPELSPAVRRACRYFYYFLSRYR
jgi:hypothetical protein